MFKTRGVNSSLLFYIQKRFRYKKKWATTRLKKKATEHAMSYFDSFYSSIYGQQWPSIRVALLSLQKYGALVNNFANPKMTVSNLLCGGAQNILEVTALPAQSRKQEQENHITNIQPIVTAAEFLESDQLDSHRYSTLPVEPGKDGGIINKTLLLQEPPESYVRNGKDNLPTRLNDSEQDNIYEFMPVKKILSEADEIAQMEMKQGYFDPESFEVNILPEFQLRIPPQLKMFACSKGDVSLFPPPRKDTSEKLDYYLLDAASVLPVIALDLCPGDRVLDLCAAPGGKSLAVLQTLLPGELFCVDSSYSRYQSLKDVLRWYVPASYIKEDRVRIIHEDGIKFCENTHQELLFDKILVDVPCYTDRHVLFTEDSNIFHPSRTKERLQIQTTQKNLLCSAIKSCKPGGVVVFSTCTLAMGQNDGLVQAALEHIWETTSMDVAVVDTSILADSFQHIFNFFKCRYGQLILPNLLANFGPTYFCKIRRLK